MSIIPATPFSNKTRSRLQHLLQDVGADSNANSNSNNHETSSGANHHTGDSRPSTRDPDSEDTMIKNRVINALNGLSGARLRKLLVPCMWLRVWRRRKSRAQQEARQHAMQLEEYSSSSSSNNNKKNEKDDDTNNDKGSPSSKPHVNRSSLTSFFTSETNADRVANQYHQQPSAEHQSVSSPPTTIKRRQSVTSSTGSTSQTLQISGRHSYRTVTYQTLLSSSFAMKAIGEHTLRARCTGRDGIDDGAVLEMFSNGQILLHAFEPVQATGVIVLLSGTLCVSTSCREAVGRGPEPGEAPSETNYFVQGPAAIFPDRVFSDALLPYFVVARSQCEISMISHSSIVELLERLSPIQSQKLTNCVIRERAHNFKQNFPMTVSLLRATSWLVQGLPDRSVENLIARMYPISYFPGNEIFSSGSVTDAALFLRRGKIEVTMMLTHEQIAQMSKKDDRHNNNKNNNNNNNNDSSSSTGRTPNRSPDGNSKTSLGSPLLNNSNLSKHHQQGDGDENIIGSSSSPNTPSLGPKRNSVVSFVSNSSTNNNLLHPKNNSSNNNNSTGGTASPTSLNTNNNISDSQQSGGKSGTVATDPLRVSFVGGKNRDENNNNNNNDASSPDENNLYSSDEEEDKNATNNSSTSRYVMKTYTFDAPLTLGELGLVLAEKRVVSVKAVTFVDGWRLAKEELDHFLVGSRTSANKITTTAIATREEWLKAHKDENFIKKALLNWAPGLKPSDDEKKRFNTRTLQQLKEGEEFSVDFTVSQNKVRVSSLLDDILEELEPCVIPARTPIAALSNTCNCFYVVIRGKLTEQRRRKYANKSIRFGPGSIIGECCALRHRWPVQICSTTRVDCWRISAGSLCSILKRHDRLQKILEASEIRLRELCDAHGVDAPPFHELKPNWNYILDDLAPKDPEADLSDDSSSDEDPMTMGRWRLSTSKGVPMETHQYEPDINFGIAAQSEVRSLVRSLSETPTARQRCIMRAMDALGLVSHIDKQRIRTPIQVRRRRRMELKLANNGGGRRGSGGDATMMENNNNTDHFGNHQNEDSSAMNASSSKRTHFASSVHDSKKTSGDKKDGTTTTTTDFNNNNNKNANRRKNHNHHQHREPQTREEKIISLMRKKIGGEVDQSSSSDSGLEEEAEFEIENQKMMAGLTDEESVFDRERARQKSLGYAAALLGGNSMADHPLEPASPVTIEEDDTGTIGGVIPTIPEYKMANLLPHLTITIATAEKLGTTSSALFALLERPSRLQGVMEGSEPGRYDLMLPMEGDDDFISEEMDEYYQSYLDDRRKRRNLIGTKNSSKSNAYFPSHLNEESDDSFYDNSDDLEDSTSASSDDDDADNNNIKEKQEQEQEPADLQKPKLTEEELKKQQEERREFRRTRHAIERNKRKWKFMQKQRRQRMMFASTRSNNNNDAKNKSRRRSTMHGASSIFGQSTNYNNNNNDDNQVFDSELMAELPASLFARRRRGPQADYKPKRPHSYEALIPDSVSQAEERRKTLHSAFQKKLESDEKSLATAREKAVRYLRHQQHLQEQQQANNNSGSSPNNNNNTTSSTQNGFDETAPISNQELLAVIFAEKDLVAEIARDAPPDLMDAAIREEDARQRNPATYATAIQRQQSRTTRKSIEREIQKIAPKIPPTTRVGNQSSSIVQQQQHYNSQNPRKISSASNLLEQSMNRKKNTELLSASTKGGRRSNNSNNKNEAFFSSYLQDPSYQEINDIVPEELHDCSWERKRLKMIRDVADRERETRPHLPEFKVKRKKWKFVSKRPAHHNFPIVVEDNDNQQEEDNHNNTTLLMGTNRTTDNESNHNNNTTKRRESVSLFEASMMSTRSDTQNNNTLSATHQHRSNLSSNQNSRMTSARQSPSNEESSFYEDDSRSRSSSPPEDQGGLLPPIHQKKKKKYVPHYARPTEKEAFSKLGEEGKKRNDNNNDDDDEEEQQPEEHNPLIPKPPPSNKPRVLIQTKNSASLGFASALVLPPSHHHHTPVSHSARKPATTGGNNDDDDGENNNNRTARTPRAAKRKWMIK